NPQPQPDPVPDHGPTPVSPTIAWSSNGKMPEAMTEITAVTVGGKVYTFGGFNDIVNGWKATNAVYRFDPATAQWTRMGNMPQRLTHVGHVADDRYVYIAGGYVTENASRGWFEAYATRNVQRYDTVTDTWAALPQLPLPRAAGGLGLIGRELHWVAGSDLNQLSVTEHWALNLDDLAAGWQARAASPVGNNHFAAVSHAGALYMIAGRTGTDAAPGDISTLYRWTNDAAAPGGGTWARLADLPAARSHAAKVIHDGRLYILGGTGPNGAVYRDVYSYDFATDAWADHTDIPAPRHSGGAASAGGKIYYFGGWTYGPVANQLQNQVWVGTPG
ncbi:MAG TPA: kelch repeat-containing protein, partial [Tepidisphaeraceae bacterium]|nr:kelch repeat-containing protein [Tepidisphaeraceae bacterium]